MTGHWQFPKEFNHDEWFGFIYRITEKSTGMEYIGKKQFHSYTRRIVKGKKNRKLVKKESDWKTYTGSCERLNIQIELNGKDNYTFVIESLHKSKGSLSYAEVEKQIKENVLKEKFKDGSSKFYNKQIAAVKFVPPEETLEERKINKR
jgi:Putative endonuclease segE, GIY-YIG domain